MAKNMGRAGRSSTADLFYGAARTYRGWRVAEVAAVLWTQQVDAAAGVGEDEKTRGGDGNRARAEEQWREEEDGWLKARRAGLFIRASS